MCELSKVLDGAIEASSKDMLHTIKYVLDSCNLGLKIEPTHVLDEHWILVCFSYSNYAGNPESCQSVSGYILFVKGVHVAWQSKGQQNVMLSSSEAEWIALSEATKEIMFIINLLESMKIKVKLPVIIYVDNTGAIFMGSNVTTTSHTKCVDIRTKYI